METKKFITIHRHNKYLGFSESEPDKLTMLADMMNEFRNENSGLSLQQVKDKIAVNNGFKDWDDYRLFMVSTKVLISKVLLLVDIVAEEYHKQGRYFTEDEIRKVQEIAYEAGSQSQTE